jgi:hypothetical protein
MNQEQEFNKEWFRLQRSEARMEKIENLFQNCFYWVDVDGNKVYDRKDMKHCMYYEVIRVYSSGS